jgi:hypothetical protein
MVDITCPQDRKHGRNELGIVIPTVRKNAGKRAECYTQGRDKFGPNEI